METVVLVEGRSDVLALEAAAARCAVDLDAAGVEIVAMGGVTNIARCLATYGPSGRSARLAGLCDAGEAALVRRSLARAGLTDHGFFVCDRDLEDELIRALGHERVEAVIDAEGELASLRRLQQMPFHRQRPVDDQLRRFMGTRSGRKHRYAPLLVDALDPDALPRPLRAVLSHATGVRA